jgi:Predicted glycosyl hydrolase
MQELHTTFSANKLLVTQAVPFADGGWNYKAYNAASDYSILMAYDQHYAGKEPGPVAAQSWFEQTLVERMKGLNPAKTIVAIGSYGYDWSNTEPEGKTVTFQEALITAR